jgi:hypothetical protein
MVGPHPLREDWCEIEIIQPYAHDEKLIRPYSNIETIGDGHGAPIAWPVSLVRVVYSIGTLGGTKVSISVKLRYFLGLGSLVDFW